MTTAFTEVPIISIANLTSPDTTERAATVADISAAARDVGFFYISDHGVPPELFAALLEKNAAFFALPHEDKMKTYIGKSSNHRGYVPVGEESYEGAVQPGLKEAFDTSLELPVDDPDYLAGNPMLGPNVWPDIAGIQETVTQYYAALTSVGDRLLAAFAEGLGLEPGEFAQYVTKAPSQLRLMHYWEDPDAENRSGIGAHTDFEVFTLLKSTAPGLEVLNGAGEWIAVPPVDGAYVINVGDLLELWTAGRYIATTHRVRAVREERYSFPLFYNVDYHTEVRPLPRFAADTDREWPTVKAGEHLYSETIKAFAYLRARLAEGTIAMPESALETASFGQGAIHGIALED